MEKNLKERIIGAIVLVAVVVLVVPVFLDGPSGDDEIISERVLLPGQEEQRSQTVVLDRDRSEPVPAQSSPDPVAPEPAAQEPVEQEPAEQPQIETGPAPSSDDDAEADEPPVAVAAEETAPEPVQAESVAQDPPEAEQPAPVQTTSSSTGMWAVQLGSFSSRENAENLAADLRRQGFAAFLSQLATASGQLHRVRIGPQKDREAAEAMASRLQTAGHAGQVVPHP